jgi:hypothetical protein
LTDLHELALLLDSSADLFRTRMGQRYQGYMEQARTAILITMTASDIPSPLIAAVRLGASGELAALMGSEADAFGVLIQAALQLSCPASSRREDK